MIAGQPVSQPKERYIEQEGVKGVLWCVRGDNQLSIISVFSCSHGTFFFFSLWIRSDSRERERERNSVLFALLCDPFEFSKLKDQTNHHTIEQLVWE